MSGDSTRAAHEGGDLPDFGAIADQLKICLNHARDLVDAASILLSAGKANIAYHLATLALEEVGRYELLILQAGADREAVPPAWPAKHRQDHVQKLFWAFFGAEFGRTLITKGSWDEWRDLAQSIHETRMSGLYPEDHEGDLQVPSEAIPTEQAQNLINIATARLGMIGDPTLRSEVSKADRELQRWMLAISHDHPKRQFIFSQPAMEKLAELQDVRAWIIWLKEQFDDAAFRGRALLEAELARSEQLPTASAKKKWLVRVKFVSASHQVAAKALREWNEHVGFIKIAKGPEKNELFVDFYFNETLAVQNLFIAGWTMARRFAVAMSIATGGLWWWQFAKYLSRYHEFAEDLDAHQRIEIDQQPRLSIDWGQNVLSQADLERTMRCLAALPTTADPAIVRPYDYYIGGLNFFGLVDVNMRCEIDICGNFHESLKAMMASVGQWDGTQPFTEALTAFLDSLKPTFPIEQRQRYLEIALAFEQHAPEGHGMTLSDAVAIKVLCDLYFLHVVMPRKLDEMAKADGAASGPSQIKYDSP